MLKHTENFRHVTPELLKANPGILACLRMCCCPPIARDRLIGLAQVNYGLVDTMETEQRLPARMKPSLLDEQLIKIGKTLEKLADKDIFFWPEKREEPTEKDLWRASSVVGDRLCGAAADPIIRNAQEAR